MGLGHDRFSATDAERLSLDPISATKKSAAL
jgi:hypothetical protein